LVETDLKGCREWFNEHKNVIENKDSVIWQ
jgi:hypothetical protein